MIGRRLAHFEILEQLGEGGMGVVYKARDEKLDRLVALKVLHPEFTTDEQRRRRFVREARTAASLSHPNIATIHEIGEVGETSYIAMELVVGETLGARIDGRPLATDAALDLAVQIADGLARAHESGIVHRDLKPDNVIVGPDGRAKILDFGLAKIFEDRGDGGPSSGASRMQTLSVDVTRDGRILGTVAYMSPEQARGKPVEAPSDVFSFGIVLFEMVTGTKPFAGETITDTLSAILRDHQPAIAGFNPRVPAELERIIGRCLEKDPADRYRDGAEVLAALRRLKRKTESHSVSDPLPLVVDPLAVRRRLGRRRGLIGVAVAAAIVAIVATGAMLLPPLLRGGGAGDGSVAVLPFENLQDGSDPQRFGQILQELIITDLSGAGELPVVSAQRLLDIQRQRGGGDSPTIDRRTAIDVARRAGAAQMLTGSVSRLGETWILTTQLIDLADGNVIDSERIDGGDLYSMVDDLTHRLRDDLFRGRATGVVDVDVRERTSSSIDAYRAYLEGQDALNALEWEAAEEAFRRATEIDPDFGLAYYKLAIATWWAQGIDRHGDAPDAPGDILEGLLDGDLKLTERDRMLAEAALALVRRDTDAARERYRTVVERYPDEKEAWYGLGESLRHGTDDPMGDATLDAFRRAIELDPSFRLAYFHTVEILAKRERYDEAIELVREVLDHHPDDHTWWPQLAHLVAMRGDPGEVAAAEAEARDALAGDEPALLEYLASELEAWATKGDADEVIRVARTAARLGEPGSEVRARGLTTLGMAAMYTNRAAEAERALRDALATAPGSGGPLDGLLELLERERRPREALAVLDEAVAAEPDSLDLHAERVRFAVLAGDDAALDAALADAGPALDAAADRTGAERRLEMAAFRASQSLDDWSAALTRARRILELAPDDPDAMGLVAWAAGKARRDVEAADRVRRTLEARPTQADALKMRIILALRGGDADEAVAAARALVDAVPQWGGARRWLVRALLRDGEEAAAADVVDALVAKMEGSLDRSEFLSATAAEYLLAGRSERAIAYAERAIGQLSGAIDPMAWTLLALGRLHAGDRAGGEEAARTALESEPRSDNLILSLAAARLLDGDATAAEALVRPLLDDGVVRQSTRRMLATALAEAGRHAEAEAHARRAVEMEPDKRSLALLAFILVAGSLDVDEGLELARRAAALPADPGEDELALAYDPPAEQTIGRVLLGRGDRAGAIRSFEAALAARPGRASIRADLDRAR